MQFSLLVFLMLKWNIGYYCLYFNMLNMIKVLFLVFEVMIDLCYVLVVLIQENVDLDIVMQKMIVCGVCFLLVVNDQDDVIGIIMVCDLMGNCLVDIFVFGWNIGDVWVVEIMIGQDQIEVFFLDDVLYVYVGDIVEMFKYFGCQYVLVVEDEFLIGKLIICGIFFVFQIVCQLGIFVQGQVFVQIF